MREFRPSKEFEDLLVLLENDGYVLIYNKVQDNLATYIYKHPKYFDKFTLVQAIVGIENDISRVVITGDIVRALSNNVLESYTTGVNQIEEFGSQ